MLIIIIIKKLFPIKKKKKTHSPTIYLILFWRNKQKREIIFLIYSSTHAIILSIKNLKEAQERGTGNKLKLKHKIT